MFYCGIGARSTPPEILTLMKDLATYLETRSWTLRSGGAQGADSAFSEGVIYPENKTIYIPWNGFNGLFSNSEDIQACGDSPLLAEIAAKYHPTWDKLTPGVIKLHTRNVAQVLGRLAKAPSKFVVCWTPNGDLVGGTAQALRIAKSYNIPIFNLGNQDTFESINNCAKFCLGSRVFQEDFDCHSNWKETRYN